MAVGYRKNLKATKNCALLVPLTMFQEAWREKKGTEYANLRRDRIYKLVHTAFS